MSKLLRNQYITNFCDKIQNQERFFIGIVSTTNIKCRSLDAIRRQCDKLNIQVIKIKNKMLQKILIRSNIDLPANALKNQIFLVYATDSFELAKLNHFLKQKEYKQTAKLIFCADKRHYVSADSMEFSDKTTAIARLLTTVKSPIVKKIQLFLALSAKT